MALASIVISSGGMCRYGGDANRSDDTLSLKISCRNAARTIRGGRFLHSVPLRSTTVEMTEGAGRLFYNLRPKGATTTL